MVKCVEILLYETMLNLNESSFRKPIGNVKCKKCKFQIKVSVQTTKLQSHKTVKQKSIRQKKKRKTWIFSIKYFKVPEAAKYGTWTWTKSKQCMEANKRKQANTLTHQNIAQRATTVQVKQQLPWRNFCKCFAGPAKNGPWTWTQTK